MIKLIALSLTLVGCGIDTGGDHNINVRDSKQEISVTTTMDTILEVCGIILADGTVVPYSEWTGEQEECLDKLDGSTGLPNLGGLDEETIQDSARS